MAYKRKTRDIFEIRVLYSKEYGYERVCSEDTWAEAQQRLKEYRENEPQYPSKIVRTRERIPEAV